MSLSYFLLILCPHASYLFPVKVIDYLNLFFPVNRAFIIFQSVSCVLLYQMSLCNLWNIGEDLSVSVLLILIIKMIFLVPVFWSELHCSCYFSGWLFSGVRIHLFLVSLALILRLIDWGCSVFCHRCRFYLSIPHIA